MPQYATYVAPDARRTLDGKPHRRRETEVRLSPQEQLLVEAGAKFLPLLSRRIWQRWSSKAAPTAYGNLSEPLSLGAARVADEALLALAMKVNQRLDAGNLSEWEEHDLMNDLAAVESAEQNIKNIIQELPVHRWVDSGTANVAVGSAAAIISVVAMTSASPIIGVVAGAIAAGALYRRLTGKIEEEK